MCLYDCLKTELFDVSSQTLGILEIVKLCDQSLSKHLYTKIFQLDKYKGGYNAGFTTAKLWTISPSSKIARWDSSLIGWFTGICDPGLFHNSFLYTQA